MLIILLAIQAVTLISLLVLLFRKPSNAAEAVDPRLAQLLAADLPSQLTRLDARFAGLDSHLRGELSQLRTDSANASAALRGEVLASINTLGETLRTTLADFRKDNNTSADSLRNAVEAQLKTLSDRFTTFTSEVNRTQAEGRETLNANLKQLGREQNEQQEKLRLTVEEKLQRLTDNNEKKLEQMRNTVDEKLQETLNTRLTESFGKVTDQLTKVHAGLGEMSTLAAGVGDLKKVLSNVKSRGNIGEGFLEDQLSEIFTPEQYVKNARIKPGTTEAVEFALRVPNGPDSTTLLSIDSKFPVGDWERLQDAYESGTDDDRKRAGNAFERAIREQGKTICSKYIDPPTTLPFAIMYLPTESLYAEVMRRPGLHAELQSSCQVHIAGPSTFGMMMTTFRLVFRTLKFEKNLNEVWKVFQVAQNEFERFGGLMEKVEGQVGTVQRTLKEISGKTKTVNRALKNVSKLEIGTPESMVSENILPLLAANEDD